jgi:hypothetical protein
MGTGSGLLLVDSRNSIDYQFETLAKLADEVLLLRNRLNNFSMPESKQGLPLDWLAGHTQTLLKKLPAETRVFLGAVGDAWPVLSVGTGVFDSERFAVIESISGAKDYLEELSDPLSEVEVLLTVHQQEGENVGDEVIS